MFIKENRISMLFYLLKRKSMKITNRHRHITKSEYQPGIAMQAHDTTLLTLEDTTGNTDFCFSEDNPPKGDSSVRCYRAWIRTNR